MLTNFHFTAQLKYNGITNHNISRSNRAGFFIAPTDHRYTFIKQRVAVRVSDYRAISLLPNAANSATKKLKKT